MPSYVYRPDHPKADNLGFIDKQLAHMYDPSQDKRMTLGNQPIYFNFIGDEINPTRHMANGKYYTSKKKFRDATKAAGCVEVGNESPIRPKSYTPTTSRKELRENIRQGIRALKEETLHPQELAEVKKIGRQIDYQNRNRRRTK